MRRLIVSVAVAATFAVSSAFAATTLRFGHANNQGEIATDLFQEFADNVTKRTKGEVTIKVFPAEQLGKEADLLQQVKSGALDISAPSMAGAVGLVPGLEIASAPFLWTDWAEAETVIRGPAFEPLFDELADKHNIAMLSKIWYWGWRNVTTSTGRSASPRTSPA